MNKVILCVDNDPEDLDIFREAITETKLPLTCVPVLSGMEALSYLASNIPDFIFLDINMPVMNGREVLKSIRGLRHLDDVPVVIMSTSISDREDLMRQGATECIAKSGNFHDLCLSLKKFFQ